MDREDGVSDPHTENTNILCCVENASASFNLIDGGNGDQRDSEDSEPDQSDCDGDPLYIPHGDSEDSVSDSDDIPLNELFASDKANATVMDRQDVNDEDVPLAELQRRLHDGREVEDEARPLADVERSFLTDDAPPENNELRGRKRARPETWKRNVRNAKRNRGESYESQRGTEKPARKVLKARCKGNCKRQGLACDDMTENDRSNILAAFWRSGKLEDQRAFICKHVRTIPVKRRMSENPQSRRNNTQQYTLTLDGETKKVCKIMFLNTTGISERQVKTALQKQTPEGAAISENRGRRPKTEPTPQEQAVLEHILLFPRVESHYCRSSTNNMYISNELNVSRMHVLYKAWCLKAGRPAASYKTYYKVFIETGLKFHRPKKDQCGICSAYNENSENSAEYVRHIQEKTMSREAKASAKLLAGIDQREQQRATIYNKLCTALRLQCQKYSTAAD